MPELPEVEAARRAIEEHCLGKRITKAVIANDNKVIEKVSSSDFESALIGKTLISALRKGKNLWLQLDSPPFPSFQFGMTGAVYIKGVAVAKYKRSAVKDTDEWPSKYSKVFIQLDDGLEFSFTDPRRFARVRLLEDPASVPPISELGPDALLEPMSVDEFHESLSKKKVAIKKMLLEQSFISGVGNWIADEVLYQARIHPSQNASTLSKESCTTLLKCIKEVIEKAVEVGADSSLFPNNWIFHSREKKPGKAFVDGKKIDFIDVGGRTTAYVPELQKLVGNETVKVGEKSKPRKDGDDVDGATEELATAEPSKSKREVKPRGRGRNPPTKRKSTSTDEENEDDNEEGDVEYGAPEEEKVALSKLKREVKPRGRGNKPPPQQKSNSSDGDNGDNNNDDASNDEIDDDEPTKRRGRVTNNKQAKTEEKASKRTVSSGRNAKKKAK